MNTPLDLETSRAIFELVGRYETEKCWERTMGQVFPEWCLNDRKNCYLKDMEYVPAPTFSEVLRILTKIGEKKNTFFWSSGREDDVPNMLMHIYMHAPTEPQAMRAVGEYLIKLLK